MTAHLQQGASGAETNRDSFPERRGDWMQTYTGRRFWPLDPRPEDVVIEDIAHALALQTRFGGHSLRFYSFAEHSVHLARAASKEAALWLLLHDGSEAYLSDMVRPLKRHMPEYRAAEDRVAWAVYEAFDLDPGKEPAEVKERDCRILIDERAQNMLPTGEAWNYGGATEPLGVTLQFWTPEQAEREFLATFAELTGWPVTLPALASRADGAGVTAGEVDRVCHEEQMTIWSGEVVGRLSMGGWLRDDLRYDDTLEIHSAVSEEIRSIVTSAFSLSASAPASGAERVTAGEDLAELSAKAAAGPWHVDMFPFRDVETGEVQPPQCEGICTHDEAGGLADSIATCSEPEARFIVALVNAYRGGHLSLAPAIGQAGAEDAPDWLLKFVIDQAHTAGLRAIPGSDLREIAKRASAWASELQARRAEMLRTASECDDAETGSGAYRRGVAQGIAEALTTDAPSDHDVRLAVVQFMRDMNAPEFEPADCAKLLAKRLKALASGKPAPDSTRTGDEGTEDAVAEAIEKRWDALVGPAYEGDWIGWKRRDFCREFAKAALAARPAAPEAQGAEISRAARDVLAERRRQVEVEGWTPEHDDTHTRGEMASAAACYATELDLWTGYEQADRKGRATLISAKRVWPWSGWWKPTDRRRNLVKAGALILAEIERLDRLPAPPASSGQGGR